MRRFSLRDAPIWARFRTWMTRLARCSVRCSDARLDDNTIVLLLADHGDMLGERGLWYKMNFFEPACRIPLIVCAPGQFAPRRVGAHASLLDVLPTLVELGQRWTQYRITPSPLDGHSLVPDLTGRSRRAGWPAARGRR